MFRTQCLCCASTDLREIIHLGMHPLADSFIPVERAAEPDRVYLLACDFCARCGQIQNRTVTAPEERYAAVDYSYTSSHSKTSRDHWTDYARRVSGQTGLQAGNIVLEIGSNDGFLSACFVEAGARVLGVDASPVMARLAAERGVETVVELFGNASLARVRCVSRNLPNLSWRITFTTMPTIRWALPRPSKICLLPTGLLYLKCLTGRFPSGNVSST